MIAIDFRLVHNDCPDREACGLDAGEETSLRLVASLAVLELAKKAIVVRTVIHDLDGTEDVDWVLEHACGYDEIACRTLAKLKPTTTRVVEIYEHPTSLVTDPTKYAQDAALDTMNLRPLADEPM